MNKTRLKKYLGLFFVILSWAFVFLCVIVSMFLGGLIGEGLLGGNFYNPNPSGNFIGVLIGLPVGAFIGAMIGNIPRAFIESLKIKGDTDTRYNVSVHFANIAAVSTFFSVLVSGIIQLYTSNDDVYILIPPISAVVMMSIELIRIKYQNRIKI